MYTPNVLIDFDPSSLPSRIAYEFQPYKPQLTERNLTKLFEFIWRHDVHVYEHPRYRLQIALATSLFFHLGLYPTVALGEGFYYKDTTLLIARYEGATRVLLNICLKDRQKHQKSGKRWSGRTMILADDPSHRYRCPVTIFLSLALADGVIEGVQKSSQLTSLDIGDFRVWKVIRYKPGTVNFPIMRRASNNSLSPSRALPPTHLHKMLHAQLQRGGLEATWHTIRDDNKKAAERERKRLETTINQPHMLIGRGQGRIIYELLAPYLQSAIMPWDPNAFKDDFEIVQKPYPLHRVVEAQLRYDYIRSSIISYLYDTYGLYSRIEDILWAFVEAAAPVALEMYYPGTEPDEQGNCLWCQTRFSRTPMKSHLLRCYQKERIRMAKDAHTIALQKSGWLCMWGACTVSHITCSTLESVTSHLSNHLSRSSLHCEWDNCNRTFKTIIDLHIHLAKDHAAYTKATLPTRAEYCFECGFWTSSELEWNVHGVRHAKNPSIIYGPISINGLYAEVGRCPYCMKKGLYRQIEKPSQFLQHVERHMNEESTVTESLSCPHPSCIIECGMKDLRKHFSSVHHIPFPPEQ